MPFIQFSDASGGGNPPQRIASFYRFALVHIQVIGPGSLRLSNGQQVLATPVGNNNQGLTITQADGIKSLWWIGELWGAGAGPCTADIEIMDQGAAPPTT